MIGRGHWAILAMVLVILLGISDLSLGIKLHCRNKARACFPVRKNEIIKYNIGGNVLNIWC